MSRRGQRRGTYLVGRVNWTFKYDAEQCNWQPSMSVSGFIHIFTYWYRNNTFLRFYRNRRKDWKKNVFSIRQLKFRKPVWHVDGFKMIYFPYRISIYFLTWSHFSSTLFVRRFSNFCLPKYISRACEIGLRSPMTFSLDLFTASHLFVFAGIK